jgi:RimJ/RimL family protein N-acetyltransferase
MIRERIAVARQRGMKRVVVMIRYDNTASRGSYERLGFRPWRQVLYWPKLRRHVVLPSTPSWVRRVRLGR